MRTDDLIKALEENAVHNTRMGDLMKQAAARLTAMQRVVDAAINSAEGEYGMGSLDEALAELRKAEGE
jgi:hypothetical protein